MTAQRAPLTRQLVVDTALALLDEVGLDGLTVRRLAAELGVKSPALYWHFRNKQELVNGMATTLVLDAGMGPVLPKETWQAWIERRARAYRTSLLAHRDGARVVSAATNMGMEVLKAFDDELASMITFGFTPQLAQRAIAVMSHFTTGFVLEEQAAAGRDPSDAGELIAALRSTLPRGDDSPLLKGLLAGGRDASTEFEHGLRVIIAGTAAQLA